jgi:hypothetical protein
MENEFFEECDNELYQMYLEEGYSPDESYEMVEDVLEWEEKLAEYLDENELDPEDVDWDNFDLEPEDY